jgi:transposase-like protein
VVCESYVRGVSTRRVEGLVRTLGIERISKSRVSQMAKELNSAVEAFRTRPLDGAPYTYLWLDAITQKLREGGRIANVAVVVATGVNASGNREILGLDVHTSEDRVLARARRPRTLGGSLGDLRCPPGSGRRDRVHASRIQLATVQNPLPPEPASRVR